MELFLHFITKKKTKYNMTLQKKELMKLEPQYSVSFVAQLTNSNSFSHPLKFFRYWRHQDYSSIYTTIYGEF